MEDINIKPLTTITTEHIRKAKQSFLDYQKARAAVDDRLIDNERWYNEQCTKQKVEGQVEPVTQYLFNNIANKHADMMESYPEPVLLPREETDEEDANVLSKIIPTILTQVHFKEEYSLAAWDLLKHGTSIFMPYWDNTLYNGLGDINAKTVDMLNVYWEPQINDIQKSKSVFNVQVADVEDLKSMYPDLANAKLSDGETIKKYTTMEGEEGRKDKALVIDWYYKKWNGTRQVVHYCKFVSEEIIYASENDPTYAERGYYDHGQYPFIVCPLYPMKSMLSGFGFIDLCRNAQEYINQLDKEILENADICSNPKLVVSDSLGINIEDFTDLNKRIIMAHNAMDVANGIYNVPTKAIPAFVQNHRINMKEDLKEITGNTSYAQGTTGGGVTAASAIAALQEASGKLSRDINRNCYMACESVYSMIVELIRQFYTEQRTFRITGDNNQKEYAQYDNSNIYADPLADNSRKAIFDIVVKAQKSTPFHRVAQNEMAISFYSNGFFAPERAEQSLIALTMMDFEGKEEIEEAIRNTSITRQLLEQLIQFATVLATVADQSNPSIQAMPRLQQMVMQYQAMTGQQPLQQSQQQVNLSPNDMPTNVTKAKERTAATTAV